jgi:hypothetical protein
VSQPEITREMVNGIKTTDKMPPETTRARLAASEKVKVTHDTTAFIDFIWLCNT